MPSTTKRGINNLNQLSGVSLFIIPAIFKRKAFILASEIKYIRSYHMKGRSMEITYTLRPRLQEGVLKYLVYWARGLNVRSKGERTEKVLVSKEEMESVE